jgi:septum formation protein
MKKDRPSRKRKAGGGSVGAPKIILASASPRRRELLAQIVPVFLVVPSGVDEGQFQEPDPESFALRAAAAKALAVGSKYPSHLVIAADTVVVLGNETFGKPRSRAEARRMLGKLSGKEHRVITVVVLYRHKDGRTVSGLETSRVAFKRLSPAAIEDYLDTVDCLDKAGAYAIQESGDALVARLEGDYDNVVGLPLVLVHDLIDSCWGQLLGSDQAI